MMGNDLKFWMVYGLHQRAPTARHKTEQSAINESKRLARLHPEIEFFVLESTHRVVKRDVDVTKLGFSNGIVFDDNEIPF